MGMMKTSNKLCTFFLLIWSKVYIYTLWFKKEPVAVKAPEDFLKSKILTGLSSSLNFLMSSIYPFRAWDFGHVYFILFNQVLIAINLIIKFIILQLGKIFSILSF